MSFWDDIGSVGRGAANLFTGGGAGVLAGDSWGDSYISGSTLGMSEKIGGSKSDKEREAQEKMQKARMGLEQDLQRGEQEALKYGLNAGEIGAGVNRSIAGLESIVNGESEAANRMRSSGEQRIRENRSSGMANAKQSEKQDRRNLDRDIAAQRAQEKMSGLSTLLNARMGQMKSQRGIVGQVTTLGTHLRKDLTAEAHGLSGMLNNIIG